MSEQLFFIHGTVLYQYVDIDNENYSIPTLNLDTLDSIYGLLTIVQLLLGIYYRIDSVKYLSVEIAMYMVEISDDIILIYPNNMCKQIQDIFLEMDKDNLYELSCLLETQICDMK